MSNKKSSPVQLIGLKVEIRSTPKKGHLVADIFWRGFRSAKVFIKDNAAVAKLYGSKNQGADAIPLDLLRSAIGLAESRLKDIEYAQ